MEVGEVQRLLYQIIGQDAWTEVLTPPIERPKASEGVQVRGGAYRAFQQAAAIAADACRLGNRGGLVEVQQAAMLDQLERHHIGRCRLRDSHHVVRSEHTLIGHQRHV
jgi:hypothetical protein